MQTLGTGRKARAPTWPKAVSGFDPFPPAQLSCLPSCFPFFPPFSLPPMLSFFMPLNNTLDYNFFLEKNPNRTGKKSTVYKVYNFCHGQVSWGDILLVCARLMWCSGSSKWSVVFISVAHRGLERHEDLRFRSLSHVQLYISGTR